MDDTNVGEEGHTEQERKDGMRQVNLVNDVCGMKAVGHPAK